MKTALAITDQQERTEALTNLMVSSLEVPSTRLQIISTIENEDDRVSALIALIPHLTPILLSTVRTIIETIHDSSKRFRGLNALADQLPEVLPEALYETPLYIEDL